MASKIPFQGAVFLENNHCAFAFEVSMVMGQRRVQARSVLRQGAFFIKYYSIAFAILPGIAGGVALELCLSKLNPHIICCIFQDTCA